MISFSSAEILILMFKKRHIIIQCYPITEGGKILPVVLRLVLQGAKVDVVVA